MGVYKVTAKFTLEIPSDDITDEIHANTFIAADAVADALNRAGFAAKVIDPDRATASVAWIDAPGAPQRREK